MTPRTLRSPSTASSDTGPQRMSYATAEALLWGPELRKQHEWLLGEMRALQTQHDAYDTRIQTTEAVVEAAEAATSRIRHIEQQIAAMEAVDNDKAFEKWATEEITRLRIFADRNQSVRQKQVELEKEVSTVADEVEKVKDVPMGFGSLLRRLEVLESSRRQDANHIKALEREIASLKSMPWKMGNVSSGPNVNHNHNPDFGRSNTPPRVQDVEDSNTETEDEEIVLPTRPTKERIQVPRSPEIGQNTSDRLFESSPTRVKPAISARIRLFKRPSIHDSKLPKAQEEVQQKAPVAVAGPPIQRASDPPATQLVRRASPKKRKQPDDDRRTERVTRSQAKAQENGAKSSELPGISKVTSVEPTQLLSRSPMKQTKPKIAPAPVKTAPAEPTQLVMSSPRKRRKPDVAPSHQPAANDSARESLQLNAADRVKTSPRKVAMTSLSKGHPRLSCNACHRLKTKCDRARPFCGQCAKRSQRDNCQYAQPSIDETQSVSALSSDLPKKTVRANAPATSSRSGAMAGSAQDNPQLVARSISPEKPVESRRSLGTVPPLSIPDSTAMTSPARRVVPDITDYNTYLKMKAERTIP